MAVNSLLCAIKKLLTHSLGLPVAILPIYPGLGQTPSILGCIPSGLVYIGTYI